MYLEIDVVAEKKRKGALSTLWWKAAVNKMLVLSLIINSINIMSDELKLFLQIGGWKLIPPGCNCADSILQQQSD